VTSKQVAVQSFGVLTALLDSADHKADAEPDRLVGVVGSGQVFGLVDDEHAVRQLSEDEVTDTLAKIAERPYCLLSLEIVENPWLDPAALPAQDRFTCLSPTEYNELRNRLYMQPSP